MRHANHLLLAALSLGLASCAAMGDGTDGLGSGVGGKADGTEGELSYPIRLDRATPAEVAAHFAARMSVQLDNCFEHYKEEHNPDARMITIRVAERFMSNYPYTGVSGDGYCVDWWDLRETVKNMFAAHGRQRAYPDTVKEWFDPWAVEQLEVATDDEGYVTMRSLPLGFYDDVVAVQKQNALDRVENPEGVDLGALRTQWFTIGDGGLDQAWLNPVILDPAVLETDEIWGAMREAFPIGSAEYISAGASALDDFWNSHEGPEGDPAFAPIAEALGGDSITKRFYFAGGGTEPFGWSTNVLIVVDEHGQAWGMTMGYSE